MKRGKLWLMLIPGLLLALSACQKEVVYQTKNQSVGLDGAESAVADIDMRAGDVTIHGGAGENLLEAELTYNGEKEPPEVTYSVEGGVGDLAIHGSGGTVAFSVAGKDNIWDLAFNDDVPLELSLSVSDANAELDLAGLSLTRLETDNNSRNITVDLSAGQPLLTAINSQANSGKVILDLTGRYESLATIDAELNGARYELDLTGDWARDLQVTIGGGSGNKVTLKLPQDTGVSVNVTSDNNEVSAEGFEVNSISNTDGDSYANEAYGTTEVSLNINIEFDRGDLTLELAP